jgi:hypothetical protein
MDFEFWKFRHRFRTIEGKDDPRNGSAVPARDPRSILTNWIELVPVLMRVGSRVILMLARVFVRRKWSDRTAYTYRVACSAAPFASYRYCDAVRRFKGGNLARR